MVINTNPPNDDDTVTRHVFYTAMSAALDNNTNALNSIGQKLDEMTKRHSAVEKEFRDVQTSIRTTIKIAVILATLFGGVLTIIVREAFDYSNRFDVVERWKETHVIQEKSIVSLPDQVAALKYRMNLSEEEIANLKRAGR